MAQRQKGPQTLAAVGRRRRPVEMVDLFDFIDEICYFAGYLESMAEHVFDAGSCRTN